MNTLDYLVIHCTATKEGVPVTSSDIIRWHTSPKPIGRGWKHLGYSDMIHLDGRLENLTPFNQDNKVDLFEITNGVRGINGRSRHVVYVGGLIKDPSFENMDIEDEDIPLIPSDTRTVDQKDTLGIYVLYMIKRHPNIKVAGHNHFSNKACPCFDVPDWLEFIGVDERNILR